MNDQVLKTTLVLISEMDRAGKVVDGYSLAIEYFAKTNEHKDWHVFSHTLDVLEGLGFIQRSYTRSADGMTRYTLKA